MAPADGEAWKREIEALRVRLDQLETGHKTVLQEIRRKLSELESGAIEVPVPVPEMVEAVEEVAPAPVEEAHVGISPPPLPPAPAPEQAPAPAPAVLAQTPDTDGGFEMQLGRVWLVRFGVVLLLTGLILLGNFAYKNWIREMPNGVRLFGLFLCAGVLMETGRRLAAKPALRRFGEVILAGGMSFFYYCTFASHHVARLRVIDSPVAAGMLMLGAAGMIVAVSWLRNARATAVLGILLASYSTMLQPIGWMTCVSSVILAAAGVLLMLRPGWMGPGVASMAGTYGAFLGWQLLGASGGGTRDPAVMWFLPPVWIMLALPGVLDRFRETIGGRVRAWFTGGNNAAFFALFSGLWWQRYRGEDYWMVCAVFGLVLLALGIIGRRRSEIAGGVNVFQGLALLSLAMVIRLEGFQLALGLAFESLALALAFAKFRGRSEFVFSSLAAAGALFLTLVRQIPFVPFGPIPPWSAGVAALLVAGASIPLRMGSASGKGGYFPEMARSCAGMVFSFAVVMGIAGWAWWLPGPWPALAMAGVAAALCAGFLLAPRGREMPELAFGALAFVVVSAWPALHLREWLPLASISLTTLLTAGLWHWRERHSDDDAFSKSLPGLHAWVYPVAAVATVAWAITQEGAAQHGLMLAAAVSLLLLAAAIFGRISRLAPCSAALVLPAVVRFGNATVGDSLWVTGTALAMLALLLCFGKALRPGLRVATAWILRGTAFLGTCFFWNVFAPGFFGDGMAFSAILLLAAAILLKIRTMPEVWGFLALAVLWLLRGVHDIWTINPDASWRGWAVVCALVGLVVWTAWFRKETDRRPAAVAGWSAAVIGSMWATQMLVWRHDWHAVSVLWTVLGFGMVSAGLAIRLVALRQAGFCLLAMAILKVFVRDVWDFNAFTRVVAFIALGVALILLGLFYNRFAPVLKRLLEEK
ncbi:DUF2339 domain-containing protein [Luteolibacter sp. SL250]|uniref:DUF2339 domain-containing protein n=1 Tax=Luteolibacter sp. SL250 TaxID=2995170 RepID=UPI00227059B5|nr:DUF2339 domain-containing protein [Luteolibacter sp. SL250]WAC21149.1 DUF2339 domain-containing protein [Luteolibacter sp. SL250]